MTSENYTATSDVFRLDTMAGLDQLTLLYWSGMNTARWLQNRAVNSGRV